MEERVSFSLQLSGRTPLLREVRAGNQSGTLPGTEIKPMWVGGTLLSGLPLMAFSAHFHMNLKTAAPLGMGPPTLIINQVNALQICLQVIRNVSSIEAPLPRQLYLASS